MTVLRFIYETSYKMNSSTLACMTNITVFNFNIVNYHFVKKSNIPETPAYGVYVSCPIYIARVCDSYRL